MDGTPFGLALRERADKTHDVSVRNTLLIISDVFDSVGKKPEQSQSEVTTGETDDTVKVVKL
jgi:hypothetical protein